MRLLARGERNPFVARLHSVREVHFPTPLGVVHLQFDGSAGGWMVAGRFDEEKIRPHLCYAEGQAVQAQPHAHQGGVSAIGA